jgi:hypothetical protein
MADRPTSVRYENINVNTTGTNVLVAGVAEMSIYVINLSLLTFGAVNVTLEEAGSGTDRMGPYPFAANGGISMPDSNVGWTRLAVGQGLNIRLSGNVQVGGSVAYRMIPEHMEL